MRRRTGWAIAGAMALGWGEWLNRRWSRTLVREGQGGSEAVVVLGYRNPQATANFVNRWRVRAGLRSVATGNRRDTFVIFSGGSTSGGESEARLMADYAKSALGFDGTVVLEEQSRSTWENVTNVIPLLESVDRVKIASQPAHALKARAYLRRQRPDLAERLVPAEDYRPGEWLFAKPLLALYGLWTLRRLAGEPGLSTTGRARSLLSARRAARCNRAA
ncbi:GdmH transporter [Amycolatopsis thailandensis]|uniref:GdmH transporter n=1 Tax=Amycolatopsis thailandensis TaxID=589330 RepID=A0A229SEK4_9PSEU|nr:YdcF family protein [Amycolatopsis thailandensis]OXM57260.1 GdmH transporter [Amycolatopsis thailandensis]